MSLCEALSPGLTPRVLPASRSCPACSSLSQPVGLRLQGGVPWGPAGTHQAPGPLCSLQDKLPASSRAVISKVKGPSQPSVTCLSTKHRAHPWVFRGFRPGPRGISCGWFSPELLSDGRQLLCLPEHPWGKPMRLSQGDTLGSGSHLF